MDNIASTWAPVGAKKNVSLYVYQLMIDPFLRDYYFDVQANLLNICLESSCGFWVLSINIEPFYLYLILNRVYFQVILDEMSEVSAGHDLTCPLLELNFGREPQIGCIANSG